MEKQAV